MTTPEEEQAQAELEERARKLFSGPVAFLLSAPQLKFLPEPDAPEIAFCGRSNVGKSSLLNALTNRKGLARASVTPGRTQELNFFDVGDPLVFRLVDMPGYGFAKAPKAQVDQWTKLVFDYLRGRATLKRVFVLIDARHGIKKNDEEVMALLDKAAVSYQVVLTKTDKIKPPAVRKLEAATLAALKRHPAAFPEIVATSSEKRTGLNELHAAVAGLL